MSDLRLKQQKKWQQARSQLDADAGGLSLGRSFPEQDSCESHRNTQTPRQTGRTLIVNQINVCLTRESNRRPHCTGRITSDCAEMAYFCALLRALAMPSDFAHVNPDKV
ncbi:hypothetical protein EVAR_22289_1 [Eumeta japonica]|uniref:Uncharacterized protein n=1 Tax=Eumeta variegata TaxID=151549 RepID=A0A4C1UBC3_EUMVA|nr:hypothetical protein EVAR_22289_1 [Eumeta japonica]